VKGRLGDGKSLTKGQYQFSDIKVVIRRLAGKMPDLSEIAAQTGYQAAEDH